MTLLLVIIANDLSLVTLAVKRVKLLIYF